jgi:hypothetical protein
MTLDAISRDEALQVFGRRFDGTGLSDEEIAEHFDFLNAGGFLDFGYGPNGEVQVRLCGRRSRSGLRYCRPTPALTR